MADILLIRADDHLVAGVRWAGFTITGTGQSARLTAGAGAYVMALLPPQHVGEEASPPGSSPPTPPVSDGAGGTVGVWRGALSAPTRLRFEIAPGTQIPLTVAGLLAALLDTPLAVPDGVPEPEHTSIEVPWRLVIAPRGAVSDSVVFQHPTRLAPNSAPALWRSRAFDPSALGDNRLDAGLTIRAVDKISAQAPDPDFSIPSWPPNSLPLAADDRVSLFLQTTTGEQPRPARLRRLELSSLGATVDASGTWPNFEWDHHTVLGRDMSVRTVSRGVMYPLGHRAVFETFSFRIFDRNAGGAAVLRKVSVLTIVEPVRAQPATQGPLRRAFPFNEVTITQTLFTGLDPAQRLSTNIPPFGQVPTHFWPTAGGVKVLFPVSCATRHGAVTFAVPLLFVDDRSPAVPTLTSPVLATRLAGDYPETEVPITPVPIDLVRSNAPAASDIHEVHTLTIKGAPAVQLDFADGYRPILSRLTIGLPALRVLLGDSPRPQVKFSDTYIGGGGDVILQMTSGNGVQIDFTGAADRSGGLLAPTFSTTAIHRTWGPVKESALPNPTSPTNPTTFDPKALFPDPKAALLGVPLRELLSNLNTPPQITATAIPNMSAPNVEMRWNDVTVGHSSGPLVPGSNSRLTLTVTTGPKPIPVVGAAPAPTNGTSCTLTNFTLRFAVLSLSFAEMTFIQPEGRMPTIAIKGLKAEFFGDLTLIKELADNLLNLEQNAGQLIEATPTGLTARYSLPLPAPPPVGGFVIRNMAFTAAIELPFNGDRPSVTLAFASRIAPFQLSVAMFGGGGYIEITLRGDRIERFEAALEFGALIAVDFVVARGEVYVLGGVRFEKRSNGSVTITGYLRIGGCVEVLGLISVSLELCLSLTYDSRRNALTGRATLVIEIDLTLWSDKVEIDSGEWVLPGTGRSLSLGARVDRDDIDELYSRWLQYREAFPRTVTVPAPPSGAPADTSQAS